MIDLSNTTISELLFHGSLTQETQPSAYNINSTEEEEVLKNIFLKPFQSCITTYEFQHNIDLELNPLYKLSKAIHHDEDITEKSKDIIQHLKDVSKHPNIKQGDIFIIRFSNIALNQKHYQGLLISKVENKESFIETSYDNSLTFKKGIGSKKLDKACLILFNESPYTVLVIDNVSRETDYWLNDFIGAGLKNDHINNTTQYLTLAKCFITEQFADEYEVSKADQIDLLNRSVDYFKKKEAFDKQEFENSVFQDTQVIESFRNYDKAFCEENELSLEDNFEISRQAVKKQVKNFKSVIKLDKNFHIYVHGNRQMLEQGVDENGRKFYKLYYEEDNS
jgi:hypothetical protein